MRYKRRKFIKVKDKINFLLKIIMKNLKICIINRPICWSTTVLSGTLEKEKSFQYTYNRKRYKHCCARQNILHKFLYQSERLYLYSQSLRKVIIFAIKIFGACIYIFIVLCRRDFANSIFLLNKSLQKILIFSK